MSSSGYADKVRELTKPTDGPVSRYLNRRLSVRITLALAKLSRPPSPDAISVISAAVVALGGALFAAGLPWMGGLIAQLGSVLDGVDGEIARVLGRSSKGGAFFDTMLDRLADVALIFGVALLALASLEPRAAAALTLLAVSGDILVSYLHGVGEKLAGVHPALIGRIPSIASRDVRIFTIMVAGLLGLPHLGLAAVAALSYTYVVGKSLEVISYLDSRD
ncbi:MAG: CDP-alcohol phosphatidyltransferase family protein [Thermoproteota archaeon]